MANLPPASAFGKDTNETNETNYTNGNGNYTNGNGPGGRRRRRRGEKAPEQIIQQVQRQVSKEALEGKTNAPQDIQLDPEIDGWIRLKLAEWDADGSGSFSQEEVCVAMDELRTVQERHRGLKSQIIGVFAFVLVFVGIMFGTVFIVMTVTKDTKVSKSGDMTVKVPNSSPPQRQTIEMTETVNEGGLGELLDYDEVTGEWLMAENHLRSIDQVSFKNSAGNFYNVDIAELTRTDSATDDQVHMLTTGGHQLRLLESVGQLQILWKDTQPVNGTNTSGMWETLSAPGRLLDEELLDGDGFPRRLGKGGGCSGCVGGHRAVFIGHHHGRGGSSGAGCRGRCSVAKGQHCSKSCKTDQCYDQCERIGEKQKCTTYRCAMGGAAPKLTHFGQFVLHGLTLLMVLRGLSD